MNRRTLFGLVVVVLAGCLVAGVAAQTDTKEGHGQHGAHYAACAKACNECQRECDSCALHCAKMLREGKKDHMRTLGTCMDCAEFCSAAARITSRHGPLSVTMCEGCAKACDTCGAACEKFSE